MREEKDGERRVEGQIRVKRSGYILIKISQNPLFLNKHSWGNLVISVLFMFIKMRILCELLGVIWRI